MDVQHIRCAEQVEDLEPIVLEVFAKFKRGNLSEEWEKRAAENLVEWVHLYLLRPLYMEYLYVEFVCKCIYVYFTYILDGAGTEAAP